jgi:adenylosuccinate lyase
MENCALWHERDISHSSVERIVAPDANILADYMLWRLKELLEKLEVFPERMQENLEKLRGVVFSQQVLLALVEAGMSRDDAYAAVQRNALQALDKGVPFRSLLQADPEVTKVIGSGDLSAIFDSRRYLKHTDYLFRKVLDR